jgi:hypothetical protein
MSKSFLPVMPAKAGIQERVTDRRAGDSWIPAFAGMTGEESSASI